LYNQHAKQLFAERLTNTAFDLWAQAAPTHVAYKLKILQVIQGRLRSLEITLISVCLTS